MKGSEAEGQGRTRVIIISALLLGMEATPLLIEAAPDWQTMFTREAFMVVLLTFLWLGHGWARWLLTVLAGLSGLLAGYLVITRQLPLYMPVVIGALVAVYLLVSPEVTAFQEAQQKKG